MSSEPLERLPEANYYRAKTLGNGAYGSVCLVYDDDGNEFAAKTFWEEEAEGNDDEGWGDDDDGGWWDEAAAPGIDCGVLREICMLRLLNGAHPHLMAMHDVSKMVEDGEEKMLMVMPAQAGSLSGAIEGGGLTNKAKMRIAVLSLHALAFLHSHGVIHRDIKPDNILLDHLGDPVLADFSLAKVVGGKAAAAKGGGGGAVGKRSKAERKNKRKAYDDAADDEQQPPALTCGMGTPTYTAPEIVNGEAYGVKADVFSLGVVLLELFHGEALDAWKNKHALKQLEEIKAKLSDKPLPSLLKAMLEVDPEQRVSAEEALQRLTASAGKVLGGALPTAKEVYLPAMASEAVAAVADAAAAAASSGKGGHANKRAKTNGGGDGLSASRLCHLLGAACPQTAADAECLYHRSAAARDAGVSGAAACALIACKISESDTYCPYDVSGLHAMRHEEYDEAGYPELERAILAEVGYAVISCTAQKAAPLAELRSVNA